MYEIFVRRGPIYHARHPEKMIHGMAWFEIVYLGKLKKTTDKIKWYTKAANKKRYSDDFYKGKK